MIDCLSLVHSDSDLGITCLIQWNIILVSYNYGDGIQLHAIVHWIDDILLLIVVICKAF